MADETRQTLDIPNGTTFEFQDGKLIFGHDSDIVIRTNLGGYKFRKIFSKSGSVHVIPPPGVEFEVEEIVADQGDITLSGAVRVHTTKAQTVHFNEGRLVADRITAEREVVLSGKSLDVLEVKAPKVTIDPNCEGTCLVVESKNDLGTYRARGGFRSLAEAKSTFERFQRLSAGEMPSNADPGDLTIPPDSIPAPSRPREAPALATASSSVETNEVENAARGAATQEFRPDRPKEAAPSSSLPKSSVFRKRK